ISAHVAAPELAPKTSAATLAPPLAATAEERPSPPALLPVLQGAAALCTDFGCVRDAADVQSLLARAAASMGATGVVVWLGTRSGSDLQPVLMHGYSEDVLRRLPDVPRSAN